MTVGLNLQNNQLSALQQLKAAQSRMEKLQQDVQQQKATTNTDNQQQPQQQQAQLQNNFNALNQIATMNIYNNKGLNVEQQQNALQTVQPQDPKSKNTNLVSQLEEARTDVQTQEKLLTEIQSKPEGQNPEAKEAKDNPLFEKLPQELKQRKDIAQLMKQVDSEALLDPEKAVESLVNDALAGNKKAFMKLDEYSKNPFDKLQDSAGKGIEKVMAGAEGRPNILEMIASSSNERAGDAAAKLMNLSAENPRAQQGFERLVQSGAVNFTKVANDAKNMDPGKAASSINMLMMRGNLDKSDRKGAVSVLGQIASESPTGAGSSEAAKGLTKAVMSEPMDVAKQAAVELKQATLNGNENALNGLQTIAKSKDPQRAQLALSQLGEVAMSGSSNSTAGLETIKSVAQDPKTNGKTKSFAVETLGKVANAGGNNSADAAKTVSDIAVNKSNPANIFALNEVSKFNDSQTGNNQNNNKPNSLTSNLSETDTYKKVMSLQQQINGAGQQPFNFLNMFAMQPA